MADLEKMKRALRRAHEAGDQKAARRIAKMIKSQQQQESPSLMQRAGQAARDVGSAVAGGAEYAYDWTTGNVPKENLPELSEATLPALVRLSGVDVGGAETKEDVNRGFRLALGYLASSDPKQVADIATNALPNATTRTDDQGNIIVQHDGKEYYVNRPGASTSDVMQIAGEIGSYLPAARFASLGKGLAQRVMRSIVGEGATSIARDTSSAALGSEQGVSLGRAMMAGMGGAAGEAISPLAARVLPRILRNPKYVSKRGNLTRAGRRAARTAGLNPEQMDRALREEFGRLARDASPEDLPTYGRMAQGRRFGFELTRGQATRDPALLADERDFMHQSDAPGAIVRGARETQDELVDRARRDLQARLSDPRAPRGQAEPQIETPEQAGAMVRSGMRDRADQMERQIGRAYDEARRYQATLDPEGLQGLRQRIDDALEDVDLAPDLEKSATRSRQLVDETLEQAQEGEAPTLRSLETLRRRLNNRINSASTPTDRMATVRIKAAFDDHIDEMFDRSLFQGDYLALEKLKEARGLRRMYTEQFGDPTSKDRIEKIVGKISQEDPDAEEIVNYTIGWSKLGQPKEARKVLGRLKSALGTDSAEWDAMREAGFFQLVRDAAGDARTPQQMSKNFRKVVTRNKEVLDELYSDEEQNVMRQFMNAANLTRALPSELGNPSKSAFAIRDMLRRAGSYAQSSARIKGNFRSGLLFSILKNMVPQGRSVREAERLVTPIPPPRPSAPIVGAAGASAGAQYDEDLRSLLQEGVDVGKRGVRSGYNLLTE
jgi:hypothetical protein